MLTYNEPEDADETEPAKLNLEERIARLDDVERLALAYLLSSFRFVQYPLDITHSDLIGVINTLCHEVRASR